MNAAYERLVQHLDENEVKYRANSDTSSICADVQGDNCTFRLMALVDDDGELFQVFGYSPIRVPEGGRPAIAEAITRANYALKYGKFELDFNDGELRYQISQMLLDGELDDAIIGRAFGATMAMLDCYLPAFLSVIYGNELPKDAIRHVEQPDVSEDEVE
jgi:hypothetical protein